MAARGGDFGVMTGGPVTVDMKRVKARKDEIVARSNTGVTNWMRNTEGIEVYQGHGRFTGPGRVAVNGTELTAPQIFINVGARPFVPDIPGLAGVDILTSTSILALESVPEHLVIIGGSYIGLEFAQMYRRFGARVTVVERDPRLIGRDDPDVSQAVKEILEAEGITVHLGADCIGVRREGDGVAVSLQCQDGPPDVTGSHPADGRRAASQHRRPGPGAGRHSDRRPGLHHRGRPVPHQRGGRVGPGRCQRPGGLHPHLLQRLRDRGRQPLRWRSPLHPAPHHLLRPVH